MKWYKYFANVATVNRTTDKIFADFMNKNLTIWQKIKLFFSI